MLYEIGWYTNLTTDGKYMAIMCIALNTLSNVSLSLCLSLAVSLYHLFTEFPQSLCNNLICCFKESSLLRTVSKVLTYTHRQYNAV